MAECIFCNIVEGRIPSAEILSDETAYAFLDINPLAEGHVLLIPRTHYETIDEMPGDEASRVMKHVPSLVKAVQAATDCDGVNVLQNNGRTAHQLIPHVHVHIIPRYEQDEFHFNWPAESYPEGRMEEVQNKIRKHF